MLTENIRTILAGTIAGLSIAALMIGLVAGVGFLADEIKEYKSHPTTNRDLSSYAPKIPITGYCVDNDKGFEMYEAVREVQAGTFDATDCSFEGIRHDMMSCLGDDYYAYRCKN